MKPVYLITHEEVAKKMKSIIWNLVYDELKVPVDDQFYQQIMLHVHNTIREK